MNLTFGSLFAGIGGLDLGLERAGMSCSWQVELNPFARQVLHKHWPDVPRFEDIRRVGRRQLAPVDVICGGFPCQDISNAGKREGITGSRSGLWSEFARVIREVRPTYVLVENVAALRVRGLGRVLGDLATLGFDADWDCIPAAALGAPHRRDRLFVIAHANGQRRSQRRGAFAAESQLALAERGCQALAHPDRERREEHGQRHGRAQAGLEAPRGHHAGRRGEAPLEQWPRPEPVRFWEVEPSLGRVGDGFPGRVDRLRGLGNAVVPQVAEHLGNLILQLHARR
jgi:DNA (cytosine-5)-methyltransferase 1